MRKVIDFIFGVFLLFVVLIMTIAHFILKPFGIKIIREVK